MVLHMYIVAKSIILTNLPVVHVDINNYIKYILLKENAIYKRKFAIARYISHIARYISHIDVIGGVVDTFWELNESV